MSHFNFWNLAFPPVFCPIKIDLSGNTVWPQTSGFQKLAKTDHFWKLTFVHPKCKRSSLRSQCWMRLFLWFSNTVCMYVVKRREKSWGTGKQSKATTWLSCLVSHVASDYSSWTLSFLALLCFFFFLHFLRQSWCGLLFLVTASRLVPWPPWCVNIISSVPLPRCSPLLTPPPPLEFSNASAVTTSTSDGPVAVAQVGHFCCLISLLLILG